MSEIIDWNNELPVEMWFGIFGFLDIKSLVSSSMICKFWSSLLRDDVLWHSIYHREFSGLEVMSMNSYDSSYFTLCKEIAYFPPIGSRCLAEWLDEDYYSGTIRRIVESFDWLVSFPGGGSKWIPGCSEMLPDKPLYDKSSIDVLKLDYDSRPDKQGTRCLCLWRNDNEYTEAVIVSGPNFEQLYEVELTDNKFFNRPVKLKRRFEELRRLPHTQEIMEWREGMKRKTVEQLVGSELCIEFMAAGLKGWMRGKIEEVGRIPRFQFHIAYDDGDLAWITREQIKRILIPASKLQLPSFYFSCLDSAENTPSLFEELQEQQQKMEEVECDDKKVEELNKKEGRGKRVLVPATKGRGIFYPGKLVEGGDGKSRSEIWCWLSFKNGKVSYSASSSDYDSDVDDEMNTDSNNSNIDSGTEEEMEDEQIEGNETEVTNVVLRLQQRRGERERRGVGMYTMRVGSSNEEEEEEDSDEGDMENGDNSDDSCERDYLLLSNDFGAQNDIKSESNKEQEKHIQVRIEEEEEGEEEEGEEDYVLKYLSNYNVSKIRSVDGNNNNYKKEEAIENVYKNSVNDSNYYKYNYNGPSMDIEIDVNMLYNVNNVGLKEEMEIKDRDKGKEKEDRDEYESKEEEKKMNKEIYNKMKEEYEPDYYIDEENKELISATTPTSSNDTLSSSSSTIYVEIERLKDLNKHPNPRILLPLRSSNNSNSSANSTTSTVGSSASVSSSNNSTVSLSSRRAFSALLSSLHNSFSSIILQLPTLRGAGNGGSNNGVRDAIQRIEIEEEEGSEAEEEEGEEGRNRRRLRRQRRVEREARRYIRPRLQTEIANEDDEEEDNIQIDFERARMRRERRREEEAKKERGVEGEEIKNYMRVVKRAIIKGDFKRVNMERLYQVQLEASNQDLWAKKEILMEIPSEGEAATQPRTGDAVIAQWSKGFWYPGVVSGVGVGGPDGEQMTIAFDTNDLVNVDANAVVRRYF
eukprot:TRINITY_DN3640_c0_g1_i2.p1 TRINITY_DN3640_c0_g1~~TRINITY_DN3640_c0_g1_i2.p1  ORF type:complete len:974 (+),score=353.28 TRINITY_DN3640_c0_g1_i2:260-3181(+)